MATIRENLFTMLVTAAPVHTSPPKFWKMGLHEPRMSAENI